MYTEEQFEQLEQEERQLTDAEIVAMIILLLSIKKDLENELRSFYQKYGKDGVVTYSEARKWISGENHQRRLTALLLFIGGIFSRALESWEKHFIKFLTEVINKESTFFGVDVDVDKILFRTWGIDDSYWLERLEWDVNQWNFYIQHDIRRLIHQRESLEEVLTTVNKRFSVIERALNRLGITESTAISSFTRQDIFKELGITKYQFYTKSDERTCEICGSMHGVIFPISSYEVGVTASPLHPRCRCWEIPIVD